ncbi:trihelix transcription factor ENAP1 [Andrographis paniculata]|uniref:trihelix transcription factor ENAP1 n=1 Tax=Andrographis paniculata TaxID=175694 RepID=UPI0021E932C7|nr:trihelix transcription factor ENAP1 [Andrographis paniculata]
MASSPSPSRSASPPPPLLPLPPPSRLSASPSPSPNQKLLLLPPQGSKPLSPPKKLPPFPWTHQETLALIQAYQEKWYSLKKGQLKAFQWEEVAVTVAARCGLDEPSKTSTQCRHKIEKLRKRYRSELKKPYPNSWQYFEYMDQMERGPMPLNARPIAVVKSSPNVAASNDYYYNSNYRGSGDVSDESDEEWNAGGYSVEAMAKSKSKSINNIVRSNAKSGNRSRNLGTMDRGVGGGSIRDASMMRGAMNGKRKQYYVGDEIDNDDDDDDNDDDDNDDSLDDLVEERPQVGVGGGGVGTELAAEISGFADTFMRMENKKIEMMRETERYRMEMEKKKMDMILEAQRKIVDTIGRAFGAHKKVKMDQET